MKKEILKKILSSMFLVFACFSWIGCFEDDTDDKGIIRIQNDSISSTFNEVYISKISESSWGVNWLDGVIPRGSSKDFKVEEGLYDVLVVDSIGSKAAQFDNIWVAKNTIKIFQVVGKKSIENGGFEQYSIDEEFELE